MRLLLVGVLPLLEPDEAVRPLNLPVMGRVGTVPLITASAGIRSYAPSMAASRLVRTESGLPVSSAVGLAGAAVGAALGPAPVAVAESSVGSTVSVLCSAPMGRRSRRPLRERALLGRQWGDGPRSAFLLGAHSEAFRKVSYGEFVPPSYEDHDEIDYARLLWRTSAHRQVVMRPFIAPQKKALKSADWAGGQAGSC